MPSIAFALTAAAALFASVGAQTSTVPVTGTLGNATITENNPSGVVYTATLPEAPFFKGGGATTNVKGSISATAGPGGRGVVFNVNFSNLPASGGPFMYHIHAKPVPSNGNCTATAAHLDPYLRGEVPLCDPTHPETCQTGDLSGKFGNLTDPYVASYTDLYSSTLPGVNSYFGNLSVTLHFSNKTRITCANFVASSSSGTPSSNATITASRPTATQNTLEFIGGSSKTAVQHMTAVLVAGVTVAALNFLL